MDQDSGLGPSVQPGGRSGGERVGELIRRERERRQISIETVAKTLRLKARYIEAIEAGAYDQLPGDTYIRVYLRSLSRFFLLDSEDIFQRFFEERGLTGADTLRKDSRTKINLAAQEEKKSDVPLIAVFSVIVLLAFFSLMVNRQGCRSSLTDKKAAAAVSSASEGKLGAEKKAPEKQRPVSQKAPRKAPKPAAPPSPPRPRPGTAQAVTGTPETTADEKASGIRTSGKPAVDTAPALPQAVAEPLDTAIPAGDTGKVQRSDGDTAGTASLTAPRRSDTGLMALKLTIVGDSCWLRIISDGAKDWNNTLTSGRVMSFKARDSFNVHVGISDAVSFRLNGTPLQLPKRKGVVTFKADRSGRITLWPLEKWQSVFDKR